MSESTSNWFWVLGGGVLTLTIVAAVVYWTVREWKQVGGRRAEAPPASAEPPAMAPPDESMPPADRSP